MIVHQIRGTNFWDNLYIHKVHREKDLFITLSIVYIYSTFKHLLAGISEYFTLCRG